MLTEKGDVFQWFGRPLNVCRRGAFHEFQTPVDQTAAETWLDIKRALGIQHPFQTLTDDTGRGQGNKMTGADISAIAVGAVIHEIRSVQDGHPVPGLLQVISSAQSDDTPSDDNDILFH